MGSNNLKCVMAVIISVCLLLSQSFGTVYATTNLQEQSTAVSEGVVSGYHEMEPIDSSFAGITPVYERVRNGGLPVSYSSSSDIPMDVVQKKDYVTSVKKQEGGTCWAYSAVSLAESSYIINEGVSPDSLDYNEYHLVHYGYGKATDSLNLFGGDYNSSGSTTNLLEAGGNNLISLCMFASWQGASDAAETQFGSANIKNGDIPDAILGYNDAAHMENGYILTMPDMTSSDYMTDMNVVKQMIMDYGSVSVSYYSEGASKYFKTSHQYCDVEYQADHAVTLVGWDDTISASAFAIKPPGDGAWIVKNSWGEAWGADGYFYLSYYDATITENAVVFDFVSGNNYDNNYQYDGGGNIYSTVSGGLGQVAGANAFVADSNETLEAVGFYTKKVNTNYEIRIYRALEPDANPNTGTLVLTQTGTQPYVGYHTVKLNANIPIAEGERYAVVVTYMGDEDEYFVFPADKTYSFGWIEFFSRAKAYESYVGNDISSLKDLNPNNIDDYYSGVNLRIKAFTNESTALQTPLVSSVNLDVTECNIEKGESDKLTVSVLPSNAFNVKLIWSSSDEDVATVDQYGNVYGVSGGSATITVTAQDGSGKSASCLVSVKEVFAQSLEIGVDGKVISYYQIDNVNNEMRFQAILSPSDTTNKNVTWSSSNPSVLTINENGLATAIGQGYTLLTATTQDGTGISKTCMVAVERVLLDTITIYSDGLETEQLSTSQIGKKFNLDAVINPQEAQLYDVVWQSSDSNVATVDEDGVVTIMSIGTAFITASVTLDYTYTAECYVCVQEEERAVEQLDITLNGTSVDEIVAYEKGDYFIFGADILPANATNQTLIWSSSDESVARVFAPGMFFIESFGVATIYVRATDGSGVQDSITLVVKPKIYTVTFNGNGAVSGSMSQLNCEYGMEYQLPMNKFVRNNYNFTGWNTRADGMGIPYADGEIVRDLCEEEGDNITLYAQWKYSGVKEQEETGETQESKEPQKPKDEESKLKSLEAPKVFSSENVTGGIKLKWSKITGATGYIVYRKNDSPNAEWKKIATLTSGSKVSYTDRSIKKKNGCQYRYWVQASNGTTVSGYQSDTVMTRLTTLKIKSAKKTSATSLRCTWSTNTKVTGYEVRLMTGNKVYKSYKINKAKTASKTIKKLAKGKKYKVQVRSYKKVKGVGTFYSAWSTAKYITIKK